MAALVGITLWIVLATVFPGFVTIAVLYGALVVITPELLQGGINVAGMDSEWLWFAIAVTAMVLTQAVGILLEELLIHMHWLGGQEKAIKCPAGLVPNDKTEFILKPYEEYQGLYIIIAQLREGEDSQGHLKRALAQFFLTNNTLVSFTVGIITAIALAIGRDMGISVNAVLYISGLIVCLLVSYFVAVIRFKVMAKALWAVRTMKLVDTNKAVNGVND